MRKYLHTIFMTKNGLKDLKSISIVGWFRWPRKQSSMEQEKWGRVSVKIYEERQVLVLWFFHGVSCVGEVGSSMGMV